MRQKFLALYPNRAHHIYKVAGDPKWKSSSVPLATGLIDGAISLTYDTLYGAYWGDKTKFVVLDIDTGSRYHNAQDLALLREQLAAAGISASVLYRSSRSDGWHLYLPFDDFAPSKDLEQALKAYLKSHGYQIIGGQIEVFPSGNALRLPLQKGFAWLDDAGGVVLLREDIATDAAISRFLADLQGNSNNWTQVKSLIDSHLRAAAVAAGELVPAERKSADNADFDEDEYYKLIQENYEKGRQYWQTGLTQKNQRHDAIICVEHYLWHGDQAAGMPARPGRFNDKSRFRLIRQWLEAKHHGHCNHIKAGDWETVEADIKRCVVWRADAKSAAGNDEYPLTEHAQEVLQARSMSTGRVWTMDDLKKGNERRERKARNQIRKAVENCLAAGMKITRNKLAQEAGCSPNTVSKHRDIWWIFSSGSGDQSRGVLGGSVSDSAPPGSSEEGFLNSPLSEDSVDLEHGLDAGSEVAPPSFCLAMSLPANPQRQDQALRVPTEVLPLGPRFAGIQAERQMVRGANCLCVLRPSLQLAVR